MRTINRAVVLGIAAVLLLLAACSAPAKTRSDSAGAAGASATKAASAEAFGGMDALVAAAKAEGELNVIGLPTDWANYGEMISTFSAKYGIKVNSLQPSSSSQDEINAVIQDRGTERAPDVLDIGLAVALANTKLFAPYKVTTWDDIGDNLKEPTGLWTNNYGGYMSIGYDSAKVPAPAAVKDLLKPAFKGKVALNGNPTQATAAQMGVTMASLANGGSLDDISKGVSFFAQLKRAGNFNPARASTTTIANGTTPVVFDWDYLHVSAAKQVPSWQVYIPSNAIVGGYYTQAINKQAPHPAAARLWQEYLYSDEGQNIWLRGGARPVRQEAMVDSGAVDRAADRALPQVTGALHIPDQAQATRAKVFLAANWAAAVG